ncbi:apolipoprotein N-acyltransferase [Microcystis aeruginosa NIES-44]|uniref:Apolipoprotein N-acyltransferase n=1 Tax=Microcystis aeruginosa NIES-44 TaxID=449439 RepID=A0A0A1VXB5_MICAE|nr:apolipoprotein N-acyltransferase [Microcystis aeruginosa NIES-44]
MGCWGSGVLGRTKLPFAFCLLPFAFCLLPFAFCLLPPKD